MLELEEMYKYDQLLKQTKPSGKTQLVRYQYMDGYFKKPPEDAALVKECDEEGKIKNQSLFAVRISQLSIP